MLPWVNERLRGHTTFLSTTRSEFSLLFKKLEKFIFWHLFTKLLYHERGGRPIISEKLFFGKTWKRKNFLARCFLSLDGKWKCLQELMSSWWELDFLNECVLLPSSRRRARCSFRLLLFLELIDRARWCFRLLLYWCYQSLWIF